MRGLKRFAVLFVAACGGSETPIATTPCPSVAPAAQPVVDAGSDDAAALADSAADASATTSVDAAVAGALAVRDFVVARMAVATLKTIPSPAPRAREPSRPPSPPRGGFGAHAIRAPYFFESTFRISEGLPPEVVRRIVRQNYGRMRLCYEDDLRIAPPRKEKVTVRFAIGRDGEVALAEPLAGDATAGFAECYARAFARLSYPQPMNDLVVVEYGMSFEP